MLDLTNDGRVSEKPDYTDVKNRSLTVAALFSTGCQIMSALLESSIDTAAQHLRESAAVTFRAVEACSAAILASGDLIGESFKQGRKLLLSASAGGAAGGQPTPPQLHSLTSAA